jgi:hypothetical protein
MLTPLAMYFLQVPATAPSTTLAASVAEGPDPLPSIVPLVFSDTPGTVVPYRATLWQFFGGAIVNGLGSNLVLSPGAQIPNDDGVTITAQLVAFDPNDPSQVWEVQPLSDNPSFFNLFHPESGLYLSYAPGSGVVLTTLHGAYSEWWSPPALTDQTLAITLTNETYEPVSIGIDMKQGLVGSEGPIVLPAQNRIIVFPTYDDGLKAKVSFYQYEEGGGTGLEIASFVVRQGNPTIYPGAPGGKIEIADIYSLVGWDLSGLEIAPAGDATHPGQVSIVIRHD